MEGSGGNIAGGLSATLYVLDADVSVCDPAATVWPELEEPEQAWIDALLVSPFRGEFSAEYGDLMFMNAEIAKKAGACADMRQIFAPSA